MGRAATSHVAAARGRISRGTLSRDEILRATLELIESDPHQPVTMERVAAALGTRPMSLYTHVRNRGDLVDGAFDRSLRQWRVDAPVGAGWEAEVRAWCRSLGAHARRYSPLIREMSRNGRFQPGLLEKIAGLVRSLRRAGLQERALADAIRWIPQTVLGAVVLELARPSHLQSIDDEAAAIYGSMAQLQPAERAELIDVLPHFTEQGLDDLFEYSIDRIIDGIASQSVTDGQRRRSSR